MMVEICGAGQAGGVDERRGEESQMGDVWQMEARRVGGRESRACSGVEWCSRDVARECGEAAAYKHRC